MELIKTALSNGADVNFEGRTETPLLVAIDKENISIVDFLLKNGADPNKSLDILSIQKEVPIIKATRKASYKKTSDKLVQLLVDAGADINSVNHSGVSPLMTAVSNPPNIAMVQYLLSRGADVSQANSEGNTPLMITARFENGWGSNGFRQQKIAPYPL
ncbi:MAG: ankyrin repeat domain-containing protein [Veillonellales bacterium]